MKYGEIWLARFLNSVGHEYKKDRPVIIIQSDRLKPVPSTTTIVPLTSNCKNRLSGDVLVAANKETGLYCDSITKIGHIYSFDRQRFIKKIGVVDEKTINKIKKYLLIHFDIGEINEN